MTTRPGLTSEGNWLAGVAALALFTVLSVVFIQSGFSEPAGFPSSESIVANIGYAMFDLGELLTIPSEEFLVAFVIIAVVLDAALDGSLMLAKRDEEEAAAATDGGVGPDVGDDSGGAD
jgi:NADH-quinone oxidoreductase subunit J